MSDQAWIQGLFVFNLGDLHACRISFNLVLLQCHVELFLQNKVNIDSKIGFNLLVPAGNCKKDTAPQWVNIEWFWWLLGSLEHCTLCRVYCWRICCSETSLFLLSVFSLALREHLKMNCWRSFICFKDPQFQAFILTKLRIVKQLDNTVNLWEERFDVSASCEDRAKLFNIKVLRTETYLRTKWKQGETLFSPVPKLVIWPQIVKRVVFTVQVCLFTQIRWVRGSSYLRAKMSTLVHNMTFRVMISMKMQASMCFQGHTDFLPAAMCSETTWETNHIWS